MTTKTYEIICARLRVSFDRGCRRNNAEDLGLEEAPEQTKDGGLVRGLGSHWRSEEARQEAKRLSAIEGRIRREFSRLFPASPLDGIFIVPERGAAKAALDGLEVPAEIRVHVTEFTMGVFDALPPEEIVEWTERVRRQIEAIPFGKKKEASAEGLAALAKLAECPIFSDEAREEILSLINEAKLEAIDRVELKRFLGEVDLNLDLPTVTPRRVRVDPVDAPEAPRMVRRTAPDLDAADPSATGTEDAA